MTKELTLDQIHEELLCQLRDIVAVCERHGIEYNLMCGTLLGSVRHKGFIPWDDDADLLMTRDNADKLLSLAKGEWHMLNDKIGLAMGIRPELWMAPFAYIDIFILDNTPQNILIRQIKLRLSQLLYSLIKCRGRIDAHKLKPFKSWCVLIPLAIFCSKDGWSKIWHKVSRWTNNRTNATQMSAYNDVASAMHRRYDKSDMNSMVHLEFEGHLFPAFAGYDNILKLCYGDYMSLPKKLHIHGIVDKISVSDQTK